MGGFRELHMFVSEQVRERPTLNDVHFVFAPSRGESKTSCVTTDFRLPTHTLMDIVDLSVNSDCEVTVPLPVESDPA